VFSDRPGVHYDTYLVHPRFPGLPVELHWDVASRGQRPAPLYGSTLWNARIPIECFGMQAFGLPVEDELVALAVHAGKPFHQFERLIWSVDIAMVLRQASRSLDWDRLAATALRCGCRTVLAIALSHARRLGAQVPDAFVLLPGGRTRRAAVAPLLDERWPLERRDLRLNHWWRYALWDSRRHQAMLLIGELSQSRPEALPRALGHLARMAARRWWELGRRQRVVRKPDQQPPGVIE
jgi:hypothetical protein